MPSDLMDEAAKNQRPDIDYTRFLHAGNSDGSNSVGFRWSKYIPESVKPFSKQILALSLDGAKDLLYGGAAGGGKSEYLLCAALQYADVPGYSALILRKHLTDLKLANALLDRAMNWLRPYLDAKEVVYRPELHTFEFDTQFDDGTPGIPAKVQFGYIGEGTAENRYQGAEFQFIGIDEAGQHAERDATWLFSRLRKISCSKHKNDYDTENCPECRARTSLPLRFRLTANPGGVGHEWLKRRYLIRPMVDVRDNTDRSGEVVPFRGYHPNRPFIPSYWGDNPALDASYGESLDETTGVDKAYLRDGNWDASPDSRFKREWARYYDLYRNVYSYDAYDAYGNLVKQMRWDYRDLRVFCTVDPAATAREGPGDDKIFRQGAPSKTVISTWGVTPERFLLWLDCNIFSIEIPDVIEEVRAVHRKWKPFVIVCEGNGPGLGVYQPLNRLGLPMEKVVKSRDKVVNATQAIMKMSQGRIFHPKYASWLDQAEGELFSWFGHPHQADDVIDTVSDAANFVARSTGIWYERDEVNEEDRPLIEAGPAFGEFSEQPFDLGDLTI